MLSFRLKKMFFREIPGPSWGRYRCHVCCNVLLSLSKMRHSPLVPKSLSPAFVNLVSLFLCLHLTWSQNRDKDRARPYDASAAALVVVISYRHCHGNQKGAVNKRTKIHLKKVSMWLCRLLKDIMYE